MSEKERGDIEELLRMALSAGSGLADEATFGASEKYSPEFVKQNRKEYPGSSTVGQVGSYFIPGLGVIGYGKAGLKALGLGAKAAQKIASSPAGASMLKKLLTSVAKGGVEGGVEAGGQTQLRRLTGTSKDDVGDSTKTGAGLGALLRGISPVAGAAASKVYSHPAIFNPKSGEKGQKLMEKLMNEGVWGGEGTFRKYSRDAKQKYNTIMDPMREKIANRRVSFDDVVGGPEGGGSKRNSFAEREWNKKTTGSSAVPQFKKTREGAQARLGDRTSMKKVQEYQKVLNEELSALAPQKRAEAISGVGGNASNEDQALGAMKASIQDLEERLLSDSKKFGKEGAATNLKKMAEAQTSYGEGRELERALNRPESLSQVVRNATPIPAAAGGLGALGSLLAGVSNPAILLSGLAAGGLTAAGRSLPGRTATGVALNKFGKDPSKAISGATRATESMGRSEPGTSMAEEPAQEEDPFSQFVPKAQAVPDFQALPDKSEGNPRKKSRGALGLTKKQLEEIRKVEGDSENPFLQYVPSR